MENRLNELKKLRRYYLAKAEEAALNNNESESKLFAEKAKKIDEEIGNLLSWSFQKKKTIY